MLIYNMQASWWFTPGPSGSHITQITQPALDTFAVVALTKTRGGGVGGGGAGGYCGISECNGDDLGQAGYPPAHFRRQVRTISFGIVSESQYAEGMITLFREA